MSTEYEAKLKEIVIGMGLPGMDDHLAEMIAHAFTKFDEKEEGIIDVSALRLTFAACDLDIPGKFIRYGS
jgi:Ca2+-binding EF-hand superfamily protein